MIGATRWGWVYWLAALKINEDSAKLYLHHGGKGIFNYAAFDMDGSILGRNFIHSSGGREGFKEEISVNMNIPLQLQNLW